MALMVKPENINQVWASGGDNLYPGDTKYAVGWNVELPPRQFFNYIDNKQDQFIAHINQLGIVLWDSETEYQAGKSYVQGSNGTVYKAVTTNTGNNPVSDASGVNWKVAFADTTYGYSKTEADARYLRLSNNLSDLSNAATARTNLDVYSKTETYTKTEVDAKVVVATTAQAQALTSNTALLTPLALSNAYKGANQNTSSSGYQKLPGGLVIQWGGTDTFVDHPGGGEYIFDVVFPIAFSATPVHINMSIEGNSTPGYFSAVTVTTCFKTATPTGFKYVSGEYAGEVQSLKYKWFAIGYV